MTISYIKSLKNNLLYSLFFLLLFTACSKENEENIRPITDLPCEEQGTYFLSATMGDSVLCYASDSSFNGKYGFSGYLGYLPNYENDTSGMYVQISEYDNDGNSKRTIQYHIPIIAHYELKDYSGIMMPFYETSSLVESITNKTYSTKNLIVDDWLNVADFNVRIVTNNYNDFKASYFGIQDSSTIRLFDPVYLYSREEYNSVKKNVYRISYETQTNLYDLRGNYLYPFKAKGTFRFAFFILN
ncbi:hypothetical protein Fleli_1444 [Bernardetia litoralis DSM 6794]|uniref:Lipoprotein n=1 Tax=Bernardetia litoralis (strain ATCC 23117 / DSM 6794 / NBRC 15988 / NCIMB 1366 / Fx l1 / Sio-4) TaxID=880071 RepID=I4AIT6_BERLS|nr:hypothetical protein [Bernardetia litoralis]AFM03871.1 hypothetical protein Fleli_1444 [Bernardetia litoralis DSM 6794]